MTAQVPDRVLLDGEAYELAGHDGDGLWSPRAAGIPVVMASTACWRGYLCTYAIVDGRLVLDRVDAMVGRYDDDDRLVPVAPPPLLGHPARTQAVGRGESFNTVYQGLAAPVPFTGTLALGHQPLDEPAGVEAMPWEYARSLRATVDDGRVTDRADVSDTLAEAREALAAGQVDRARAAVERAGLGWLAPRLRA